MDEITQANTLFMNLDNLIIIFFLKLRVALKLNGAKDIYLPKPVKYTKNGCLISSTEGK